MKRVNGFLCIDDCKKIDGIYYNQYWVEVEGVEYYFKATKYFYDELICYHIAKFLGIDVCYCDLAILDGKKGIISKSLRKDEVKIVLGSEILNEYLDTSLDVVKDMGYEIGKYRDDFDRSLTINSLEMIWQALEFKYKDSDEVAKVMHQFVVMYIFDIIVNNWDRHSENWMIEESEDGIKLASLFDWNMALKSNFYKFYRFEMGTDDVDLKKVYFGKRVIQNIVDNFFKTSSYEYFDLFVEMFNKVTDNFEYIIGLAEEQIQKKIPDLFKLRLLVNFYMIRKCINNAIDVYVYKTKRQC